MSDTDNYGDESIDTDLGSYSVDDEDQPDSGDSLVDRGLDDALDEGYSPPEKPRGVNAFGTTAAEQHQGESLEQRMAQEEPDPTAYFDDPLAEPDTGRRRRPRRDRGRPRTSWATPRSATSAPAAWWLPTRGRTRTPSPT